MQIEKFESDIYVSGTKMGELYVEVIYTCIEGDRAFVKLRVTNSSKNMTKVVVRRGKCYDGKFVTSVDKKSFCINLNTGAIIEPSVKNNKHFAGSARVIGGYLVVPMSLEYDGIICKCVINLVEEKSGEVTTVAKSGKVVNNIFYTEVGSVKFNINIRSCAVNKTLE